uniref:Uncharacterized protein n=1 Tax=Myotis myotis TaxID=51298 RepID=A0A7J7VI21_MYOMY|nr:hypothetical protein mMyoMyo1_008245 [Myotis myotis]
MAIVRISPDWMKAHSSLCTMAIVRISPDWMKAHGSLCTVAIVRISPDWMKAHCCLCPTAITGSLQTGLAQVSLLKMHVDPRAPATHCEWPGTDFAFLPIPFFGYSDICVFSKTHLAKNGEARILPALQRLPS